MNDEINFIMTKNGNKWTFENNSKELYINVTPFYKGVLTISPKGKMEATLDLNPCDINIKFSRETIWIDK